MLTSYIIRARPCKHSDVISLKYTDIRGGSLDWISGFQSGFLDFKVDFWISDWISGFQSGFLDFVGFLDFRLDFCRQCTRFLSWRTPRQKLLWVWLASTHRDRPHSQRAQCNWVKRAGGCVCLQDGPLRRWQYLNSSELLTSCHHIPLP